MKCTIPEISWHNREPVLSVDLQSISDNFYRLATGGADCHVVIWQLIINANGAVKLEALADLTRHQKAVNSVRWSPGGQYLATADDDANIIVWQLKTDNIPLLEGENNDRETWIVNKVMRGHKEDIYDLSWSPDGLKLLSGSIDNTAILWDFTKGKSDNILADHKGFVQGVSWDPKGNYLATISTDRVCRIYECTGKQVKARIQKGYLPVGPHHYLHNKEVKFFHDDTFKSFFRRLHFSPDGTLLVVPSGHIELEDCKQILNATYLFAVDSWASPIAAFPSGKQCSTVARFCPIMFELHENGAEAIISLPFRMIVAVGTDHDIILYDTQQVAPFAYFKDIHYTRLTDLTWSQDGLLLVASSTDGFCALITFELNELGVQYVKEESEAEESVLDVSGCEELDKEDVSETPKPKKLNLLEKWTIKTPMNSKGSKSFINPISNSGGASNTKRKVLDEPTKSEKVIKRIKPISVQNEKNTSDNVGTPKSDTVKRKEMCSFQGSPLLNFFNAGAKGKLTEYKKTESPKSTIIVDEIEARDAWKCEKDEMRSSCEHKVEEIDDTTEDFSLHLEECNTNTANEKKEENKCNHNKVITIDDSSESFSLHLEDGNNLTTENNKNMNVIEDKNNENIQCEIVNDINNTKNVAEQNNTRTETNNEANLVTNQVNVNKPKRRIPLITLSSPKHKKK